MTRYERYLWLKEWYNDHRGVMKNQPSMVALIKANADVRKAIHDLYFVLLNKTLQGCSQCEADALLFLMMTRNEETMKKIANCRFKLKQGVLLQGAKGLPMVTCANLTDELAIAYLKDNPKRAKMFEFIPEDWDKEPATDDEGTNATDGAEKPVEEQVPTDAEKTAENENNAENSAPVEEKPDAEPIEDANNEESAETAQISPEKTEEVQESANEEKDAQNENYAENSAPNEEKPKRTRKPRTTKK